MSLKPLGVSVDSPVLGFLDCWLSSFLGPLFLLKGEVIGPVCGWLMRTAASGREMYFLLMILLSSLPTSEVLSSSSLLKFLMASSLLLVKRVSRGSLVPSTSNMSQGTPQARILTVVTLSLIQKTND